MPEALHPTFADEGSHPKPATFPIADPWQHEMAIHGINKCSALLHYLPTQRKQVMAVSHVQKDNPLLPRREVMERATNVEQPSLALTNRSVAHMRSNQASAEAQKDTQTHDGSFHEPRLIYASSAQPEA